MVERSIEEAAAEVLRLDQAATPGPWEQWTRSGVVMAGPLSANTPSLASGGRGRVAEASDGLGEDEDEGLLQAADNADLIAAYRTAAPELAREVQRLRRELKSRALAERDGAFLDRATKLTEERDAARARVNELLQEQDRRWDCRAPECGPPCGACTSCLVREREALEQEVGQLRTTLQGAEVLCNALKAQAAGREGS